MTSNFALGKSCDTSRTNSLTSAHSQDQEKKRTKEREKDKFNDQKAMDTDSSELVGRTMSSLRRATSKLGGLSPKKGTSRRPTRRLSKSVPRHRNLLSPDPEVWHPVEGEQRSRDIDRYLTAESCRLERQFKLLLLGQRGTKDWFWKQAKLVYQPMTDDERRKLKPEVRRTVAQAANTYFAELSDQVSECTKKKESKDDPSTATLYLKKSLDLEVSSDDPGSVHEAIQLLRDPVFHNALADVGLSRANIERRVLECTDFPPSPCHCGTPNSILGQLERVFAPRYEPVDHDELHFSSRYIASSLREVPIQRSTHLLRLIDLSNVRTERKKWIHFFEDNRCVVCVADLVQYDQYLMENSDQSVISEVMILFESIARNTTYFKDTPLLLLLANVAAFKERLKTAPLSKAMPDYTGKSDQEALNFLVDKFKKACQRPAGVHVRLADSISPEAVSDTLQYIESAILKDALIKIRPTRKHGKSASA